jgi:hypothetical protein
MSGKGKFYYKKGQGKSKGQAKGSSSTATTSKESKKSITDYNYYLGSAKQASDYETTTEFLINHIKKIYDYGNDIGSALETLQPVDTSTWKPSMQQSKQTTDTALRDMENKQFEIEFKSDYDAYRKRLHINENNLTRAYALLWERCTKAMKNKIESRSDFETIRNDPISLLKAIKEHALNYQENRYSMAIVLDSMRTLMNTKQKEGELLQDYTKRFRVARDVLKSHVGGPIVLTKIVEAMPGYDETDKDKCNKMIEQAFNQFLAFLYLDNADRTKYGSILTGLNTQQSLGNDQYPRTITESNNVLSNHKHDATNKIKKNSPDGNKTNKDKKDDDNKEDEEVNLSFAQMEGKCYCCGKAGHKSPSCRDKDKPKTEWAINKAQQSHAQAHSEGSVAPPGSVPAGSAAPSSSSSSTVGWAGAHIEVNFQQFNPNEMREWILLDNQSSVTVFCNPNLVQNIRKSNEGDMYLSTNGGILVTTKKADLPEWGEVWFNEAAITNIFSYAEMADKYRITYDSSNEDAFVVHMSDTKQVRFTRLGNNLYVYKPPIKNRYIKAQLLNTVEENRNFYTQRQFDRAKRARDLYHALGTPSINDFKAMLRMNSITNNPITTEDIKIAENIFGADIGSIKGKTTRRKPAPVVNDYVEIPNELIATQRNVTLCMDGMKVNGVAFLTTVSINLQYRTAQFVKHQTIAVYRGALKELFRIYNTGGFRITMIRCDNEFRPLLDPLSQEFQVGMNFANPQEHVPEAERNNRVIKERVRATYHRLPYRHLTRTMVKMLVTESAKKLNFFPAKNGVSPYYSPRMILHQRNLDYTRHCKYAFGTYVQAHDESEVSNTNAARSLDCIYMRYNDNVQGGHELLHLQTNSLLQRRAVTPVPLTPAIIKHVHTIAETENMPAGLKLINRSGQTFYDSAWIAGVEYDEDAFDDDQDQDDYIDDDDEEDVPLGQFEDINDEDDMTVNNDGDASEDQQDQQSNNESDNESGDPHDDTAGVAQDVAQGDNDNDSDNEEEDSEDEDEDLNPVTDANVNDNEGENEDNQEDRRTTRSGRILKAPERLNLAQHNLKVDKNHKNREEYILETARVIALMMCYIQDMLRNPQRRKVYQFAQSYGLMKGLKKFGERGKKAAFKELKQLHDRVVFKPIHISELTDVERKRAMESLIFLVEKRDGTVKARTCANGSTQREYVDRDEATSPTAMTESVIITGTIEAKQSRDVMTADIPNAFVQTRIEDKQVGERIIMKIRGPLVDMLLELSPETYEGYVVYEGKNKVLYVMMVMALYGMLQSSLLYYKKFRKDIESIGFKVNPYDPCVANRMVNGKQHTITWHVDDVKSSHVDPRVNDEFLEWLKMMYAGDGIGEVKATRGHRHDYLAMVLDYSRPGVLQIDMTDYVKGMIEDFPAKLEGEGSVPWTGNMFSVDAKSKLLDVERAKIFHTFVMKGMFLCKRGRQDIQPGIAFLATRTTEPTEKDWAKLIKLLVFLKRTKDDVASMKADDTQTIKWCVDASFAVHKDFKSHTGATMTMGEGVLCSISTKQKVMSRSSTEAELIAVDDVISKIMWSKLFIEAQGFEVLLTIIYRDNTSSMKLELNGKASSGKRTRHLNIKYFYITDLIERKEVIIEYRPTDEMTADYMSKPLTGKKFFYHRTSIMHAS